MREKYLPVGTVLLLKGGTKKIMITGFCSVPKNDNTKVYDYSGCLYPEGVISSEEMCLFNHEQIENIYHMGYESEEEKTFNEKLKEIIGKITNKE